MGQAEETVAADHAIRHALGNRFRQNANVAKTVDASYVPNIDAINEFIAKPTRPQRGLTSPR